MASSPLCGMRRLGAHHEKTNNWLKLVAVWRLTTMER